MLLDTTFTEFIDLVHQTVQEVPVMGNYHKSAVIGLQGRFQDIL